MPVLLWKCNSSVLFGLRQTGKKEKGEAPFFLQHQLLLCCASQSKRTMRELPGLLSPGEQIMVFVDMASCRPLSLFLPQISRVGAPTWFLSTFNVRCPLDYCFHHVLDQNWCFSATYLSFPCMFARQSMAFSLSHSSFVIWCAEQVVFLTSSLSLPLCYRHPDIARKGLVFCFLSGHYLIGQSSLLRYV